MFCIVFTILQLAQIRPQGNGPDAPGPSFPEPDLLGTAFVLIAIILIICSFFFIYQSLNLQKAESPDRENQLINSKVVSYLSSIVFTFIVLIWLFYVWFVNFSGIRDYPSQMIFYIYNPRIFLVGLSLGNIFPALVALYSTFLLHNLNTNTKNENIGKRNFALQLIINLINFIASIVTIFVFIKA